MKEFRWSTLHFITRLIVVAAIARLAADFVASLTELEKLRLGAVTWADWFVATAHAFGYSLIFFGSAATVELLYRIWREVRHLRAANVTVSERPAAAASEPTTSA